MTVTLFLLLSLIALLLIAVAMLLYMYSKEKEYNYVITRMADHYAGLYNNIQKAYNEYREKTEKEQYDTAAKSER